MDILGSIKGVLFIKVMCMSVKGQLSEVQKLPYYTGVLIGSSVKLLYSYYIICKHQKKL